MASLRTSGGDRRLGQLENLVDELVKETPSEDKIRGCMEAAGLKYTSDPIRRMSDVIAALDRIRADRSQLKEQV